MATRRDAELTAAQWPRTIAALRRLQDLLRCSICHKVMLNPQTLTSCEHYFCRECITSSLSSGCCPECGLPGWVKDLSPNYQLAGLIGHLGTLEELLGCSSLPTSPCLSPSTQGEFPCALHSMASMDDGPSHILRPTAVEASPAETPDEEMLEDIDSPIFLKPPIAKELIRRKLRPARTSLSVDSGQEETAIFETASKPALKAGNVRAPLAPINGCSLSIPPTLNGGKITQPASLFPAKVAPSFKEGVPRPSKRRRKSVPPSSGGSLVSEFPFSPLITKTRSFSQLDPRGRIRRLKQASSGGKKFPWPVRCPSALPGERPTSLSSERVGVRKRRRKLRQMMITPSGSEVDHNENCWRLVRVCACDSKEAPSPVTETTKKKRTVKLRQLELTLESCRRLVASDSDGEDPLTQDVGTDEAPPPAPFSLLSQTLRRNVKGETPLHIAAIKGDVASVKELLAQEASPNIKDHAGWTPLHEACNHGHLQVVTLLLDHGALVNIPGYDNDTPLHDALANGHVEIAKHLIQRSADVTIKNRRGLTPIDLVLDENVRAALLSVQVTASSPLAPTVRNHHASPSLNGGPSRVVLLASGLALHHKTQLSKAAKLFGAGTVSSFSAQVTHVITSCNGKGCCTRTIKCLSAVASGKWLIEIGWIAESLANEEWADERAYEVTGFTVNGEARVTEAPRKGRENALMKLPGLFDGCKFHFQGSFPPPHPSKQLLGQLVTLADGAVLSRGPREDADVWSAELSSHRCYPFHAKEKSLLSTANRLVVCSSEMEHHIRSVPRQYLVVTASWILDSLSNYALIDPPSLSR